MTALVGFAIGMPCGTLLAWLALSLIRNRESRARDDFYNRRWIEPL